MNRRDFLKKLGIACGIVAVCPTKLLKAEPKPESKKVLAVIYDEFARPTGYSWIKLYTRRNPDGKYVFIRKTIHPKGFYK